MKTGKEIEQEYSQQFADGIKELTPLSDYIDKAMQEAIKEQRNACANNIKELKISECFPQTALAMAEHVCLNTKAI